ncbi:hypothetical protein C8R44DRAFT_753451 [Mycena epipterygia]|nr:hypothetical protein C8R44DRAFT_753451 [Mycena epipterygia]
MAPPTTVFDLAHAFPALSDEFISYNNQHTVLRRLSPSLFSMELPNADPVVIDARTVRLYTDYNVYLCTLEGVPDCAPAYYNSFARQMNAHDDSGYGWAYVDRVTGTIIYDDKLTLADAASFCVRDSDIDDRRYLVGSEVAVSRLFYETAQRMQEQTHKRDNKWWRNRQEVKATAAPAEPDVHSKASKDTFAKKRKALSDAAEAVAARKKRRANKVPAVEPEAEPEVDKVDEEGELGEGEGAENQMVE